MWGMDLTMLPKSDEGHNYLVVAVDYLSDSSRTPQGAHDVYVQSRHPHSSASAPPPAVTPPRKVPDSCTTGRPHGADAAAKGRCNKVLTKHGHFSDSASPGQDAITNVI
ncbi:hypothetical protein ACOMHN_064974 [Nucella lapillus]